MPLNCRYFFEEATSNGEQFSAGYQQLPEHRIGHCHMKDDMRGA